MLDQTVVRILEPQVGPMIAAACTRAAARSAGKEPANLEAPDWPQLETSIRGFLLPLAPETTVNEIINRIREAASV